MAEDAKVGDYEDSAHGPTRGEYFVAKGNPDVESLKTVDGVVLAEEAPLSVGVGKGATCDPLMPYYTTNYGSLLFLFKTSFPRLRRRASRPEAYY